MDFKRIMAYIIKPRKLLVVINFILLFMLILFLGVNQVLINKTNKKLGVKSGIFSSVGAVVFNKVNFSSLAGIELTGDIGQDVIRLVISSGIPEIYGPELDVSFDSVQQSINVMRQYDPTYGRQKKITLGGNDMERYISIGQKIACEFCCSVKTLVFKDGTAACGCAHSIAMRGLLAYLIQNHGAEYTDDELLRELAKWKGMYFPKQMIKRMAEQLQSGSYTPDTASLLLGLKLPDYGAGAIGAPLPSEIENLPSMVGGC